VSAAQWTPGLRGVVQFGGLPGIVPDTLIGELQQRLAEISAAGGLALDCLHPGDAVRITGGPLAGYEAVFDMRLSGTDRVRVLLEIMHQAQPASRQCRQPQPHSGPSRTIPVDLDAGWIEKLGRND
jgi:transcription antitermination factor NusG